jgi:hypothetical protein
MFTEKIIGNLSFPSKLSSWLSGVEITADNKPQRQLDNEKYVIC